MQSLPISISDSASTALHPLMEVPSVPRGAPHTFLNSGSGPGHCIVTMRPGGFEGFFKAVADANLEVPRDMAAIAEIGQRNSLEFVGPNPFSG